MVATIGPVGYGWARRRIPGLIGLSLLFAATLVATVSLLGAVLSSALLPLHAYLINNPRITWLIVGAFSLALVGSDSGMIPSPVPEVKWQVPRHWILRFRPPYMAMMFGGYLGVPFITHVRFKSQYAVLAAALLLFDVLQAIMIAACYGLGRALTIALFTTLRVWNRNMEIRLMGFEWQVRCLNGAVFASVGAFLLAWSLNS